jgi:hypothetical protein
MSIWPWRGLGWAFLMAILAHMVVWKMIHKDLAWSFQYPDSTASMNTRLLEPIPLSLGPALTNPNPEPPIDPPRRKTVPSQNLATVDPVRESSDNIATEVSQSVSVSETVSSTTQSLAEILPNVELAAPSVAGPTSTQAVGQPAPPGIKLRYPPSAQLQFEGTNMDKGSSRSGSGMLLWKTDGNSYELTLDASSLVIFSRTEKSIGQISPQGLAPLRYSSVRTGRSEQATHFRPDLARIQFSNNKPDVQLLIGAQDRVSVLIQLAGIIGGDPERYRIVNRIQMQVAGLDSAEIWEFKLEGISDINLPAANMQTLKLSRSPRHEYDQLLEVWLSPQLGYLPVRIKQTSVTSPDKDFTDLVLSKLP